MSTIEALVEYANALPPVKQEEVLDFAMYLWKKTHAEDGAELALLSEEVLAQSWLGPEDEEAWKDL